jgi:hypothetical protein
MSDGPSDASRDGEPASAIAGFLVSQLRLQLVTERYPHLLGYDIGPDVVWVE